MTTQNRCKCCSVTVFFFGTSSTNCKVSSNTVLCSKSPLFQISTALDKVREYVQKSVEIYAGTFRVNFSLTSTSAAAGGTAATAKESIAVYETLLIRFCALHRLQVIFL